MKEGEVSAKAESANLTNVSVDLRSFSDMVKSIQTAVNALRAYSGRKNIRMIKTSDLEAYKNHCLKTLVEIEVNHKTKVVDEKTGRKKTKVEKIKRTSQRKVSSVNRELETLRAMFILPSRTIGLPKMLL
jgi:hypothetical protein